MSELDRDTGWRPAKDHGLPDGTMVEVRTLTGVRWLRYIASDKHLSGYTTFLSLAKTDSVYEFPGDAEVRPLVPADEPRACTCGAKYDRCPDCAADDGYAAGRKDATCDREHDEWVEVDEDTWYGLPDGTRLRREWERGAVYQTRRFVHRDDLTADPVREAVSAIFEDFDASILIPSGEFFIRLRAAGFDVVPRADR